MANDFYSRFQNLGYGSGAPPYVSALVSGGPGGDRPDNPGAFGNWGKTGQMPDGSSGGGSGFGGVVKSVGGWITKHPDAAATIAGAATSLYGAHADRAAATKQNETENAQWQQDYALRQRDQAMREMEAQQKLQSDVAERMRRRAALGQILGMYQQGKAERAAAAPVQME